MAQHEIAHFQNDLGVHEIKIGVKKFMCCGASDPHDHPHVFLDMGAGSDIVCPYCSTLFTHSNALKDNECEPSGCMIENAA